MDFVSLRLTSSSLTCSICALATIILQLVAMECQKLHMVYSPIVLTVLLPPEIGLYLVTPTDTEECKRGFEGEATRRGEGKVRAFHCT